MDCSSADTGRSGRETVCGLAARHPDSSKLTTVMIKIARPIYAAAKHPTPRSVFCENSQISRGRTLQQDVQRCTHLSRCNGAQPCKCGTEISVQTHKLNLHMLHTDTCMSAVAHWTFATLSNSAPLRGIYVVTPLLVWSRSLYCSKFRQMLGEGMTKSWPCYSLRNIIVQCCVPKF